MHLVDSEKLRSSLFVCMSVVELSLARILFEDPRGIFRSREAGDLGPWISML